MSGLTDLAGGDRPSNDEQIVHAHKTWEESMSRRMDQVRAEIRQRSLAHLALCTGAELEGEALSLPYWGHRVSLSWPDLEARYVPELEACPVFDQGMLLYYLQSADGIELADRWIGYRELPDGAFYNQAFQGYSGKRVASHFNDDLDRFHAAARHLEGFQLPSLAPAAYAFTPLPKIRLAMAFWPGDEDFPSRASVLFDANASHYMTTDGLALLGSGLARRILDADLPE
ncbi:MAG: DUF3786 domain-containing protein [Anaerolineales bacterium]|nr:MAG: DUF3786 domain-containing protein [Anaerolineales bacterium]